MATPAQLVPYGCVVGSSTASPSAAAAALSSRSAETSVTGPKPCILIEPVEIEGRGQLHGVVGPEAVLAGHQHRLGEEGRGQLQDIVALGQVTAEMPDDGPGLGGGEVAASLPAGDGGEDLDGRDAGDVELWPALGRVRDRTQAVPVSLTWRFTSALVSRK